MTRVVCTSPHASDNINGIAFTRSADGAMISEELDADVAATMCRIPGFALAPEQPPSKARRADPKEPAIEGVDSALLDAIHALEPGDETVWTTAGAPDANHLSQVLGRSVGAEERNKAWAAYTTATSDR